MDLKSLWELTTQSLLMVDPVFLYASVFWICMSLVMIIGIAILFHLVRRSERAVKEMRQVSGDFHRLCFAFEELFKAYPEECEALCGRLVRERPELARELSMLVEELHLKNERMARG